MHGEDDQIVPVKDSAKKSARLIKRAKETYYPGAPHGLRATHQDQVNADLLAFLRRSETDAAYPRSGTADFVMRPRSLEWRRKLVGHVGSRIRLPVFS